MAVPFSFIVLLIDPLLQMGKKLAIKIEEIDSKEKKEKQKEKAKDGT